MTDSEEFRYEASDLLTLYRHRANWAQWELAQRSGVSETTIHNIETGKRKPHRGTLLRLALALGLTYEEFLRGEGLEPPKARASVVA